jgi:uncharacterized protein (DUF2336 family)
MTTATSLIPGLDDIVKHGAPEHRTEAARRIADLFFQDPARLQQKHVDLFDGLLIDLVPHTDVHARADLAERLSRLPQGPRILIGQLARENEILIAGPLLRRSLVLDERSLVEIARVKGQGHLLAMSERERLSSPLTDVLIRRGDRDVVRRAAGNSGAEFSEPGYSALVGKASFDGVLTLTVGKRPDLSDAHLKTLLAGSLDVVRQRLVDVVEPDRQAKIRQAIDELAVASQSVASERNFLAAQRTILALYEAGGLNESALFSFARAHQYEEAIAALAAMSGLRIASLDRLFNGERNDPLLIIGRTIGLEWATVHALILLRLGPKRLVAPRDIEATRVNYSRLMPETAERVVTFWKMRH